MKNRNDAKRAIERLTALWALSEAGLGGLMHALHIPLTGIFIGGIAVTSISLIAYFSNNNYKSILKALLIVLIIKGIASPHSPINAYVAVVFQGLLGYCLFFIVPNIRLASFLLAFLSLVEGGVQKILVLTIIYGTSLWDAIDIFVQFVLQKFSLSFVGINASQWVISLYLGLHVAGGIATGWLISRFIGMVENLHIRPKFIIPPDNNASAEEAQQKRKRSFYRNKKFLKIALFLAFILSMVTFMNGGESKYHGILVFIRVVTLVTFWYLFLGPFLMKKLHEFLKKKSGLYTDEVENIMNLFPLFNRVIRVLWADSQRYGFLSRWKYFLSQTLLFVLTYDSETIGAQTVDNPKEDSQKEGGGKSSG